jgi:hypothetical protein
MISTMGLSDTHPKAEQRYLELLRALSVQQRWAMIAGLHRSGRVLLAAALRAQFPDASEDEIVRRVTVRLYGREAAMRLHGHVPENAR